MSSLIVEVVEFEKEDHPNADRLAIAKIKGKAWQCIISKDWKEPFIGVYFPIDSILPPNLVEEFNLEKMTSKGRIRSVRLRGELSQGLLLPLEGSISKSEIGSDIASKLGITKYDPPIPINMSGTMEKKPDGWTKYTDIENIKNFPASFEDGEIVSCSEKAHGACSSFMKFGGELFVSSHNVCLKRNKDNSYWRAAIEIEDKLMEFLGEGDTLFGELLGVQELKYGLEGGKVAIRFFDLLSGGKYMDTNEFRQKVGKFFGEEYLVPLLYEGPFSYDKMQELSSGDSVIPGANHIREGIVIKPIKERYDGKIGRIVLKFISDDYLLSKGKKTEYH